MKKITYGIFCAVFFIALAVVFVLYTILNNHAEVRLENDDVRESTSTPILNSIQKQISFGPRYVTTDGYRKFLAWLQLELAKSVDEVVVQSWEHTIADGSVVVYSNVIGRINPEAEERIILGTHFDTKKTANKDKVNPTAPVIGANDGASGVAVLLFLLELLHDKEGFEAGVDVVFFDGEEGDPLLDTESVAWTAIGSTYFAENLTTLYPNKMPSSGVVIDMVCDRDLKLPIEGYSHKHAKQETEHLWSIGTRLYPDVFTKEKSRYIKDDHLPLIHAGIPTVLIIDLTYPYWHTTMDTIDKCSEESLQKIVDVLLVTISSDTS